MNDLLSDIRSWPWAWAWLTLFAIVVLRAGSTYGIGRLIAAGAAHGREPSERLRFAMDRVDRWGPPAVTLSFLTVGAQTVINLAAGLCRMTVPRYLLGLVPGAALWATIWTTVGAGVVTAVTRAGLSGWSVVGACAAVLAVVVVVTALTARRRRPDVETV
ncbi:DedA family protein [Aeromicrobium alkaliterrae]|uniref:SNARE associated Golgi protein n=1 Tax=Aeromicrobium alkaliterrae TaxID=302168 RepID=A0ABN2KC66_9ACTN